jgi:sugar/nucleoside kinase (ribokinase family)
MKKILGMGSALVDILIRLNDEATLKQLGMPKGSMQLVDKNQSDAVLEVFIDFEKSLAAGGSAANTVHGIGKLGGEAGFIGRIGGDDLGELFVRDMNDAGVEAYMSRSTTGTGCAISLITPDSERTFATYLGAASELSTEHHYEIRQSAVGSRQTAVGIRHLVSGILSRYDILHLEGYLVFNQPLTEAVIRMAKEAGLMVSLDLASYNVVEANLNFLDRIIREYVDIVFANEEEAWAFTGKDPVEALGIISGMAEYAIVKTGATGSLIRHRAETCRIGAIPVNPVDTTGAGDLYASGFLYGLANDLPLQRCGELGAILAGNVIEVIGPKMGDGTWEVIRKSVTE